MVEVLESRAGVCDEFPVETRGNKGGNENTRIKATFFEPCVALAIVMIMRML